MSNDWSQHGSRMRGSNLTEWSLRSPSWRLLLAASSQPSRRPRRPQARPRRNVETIGARTTGGRAGAGVLCAIFGTTVPFSASQLATMYPTHQTS
ncbi:MAG TPA: alpha/beta hydrolase domain-containing protein [Acidimicrobiales bacterium]|nr:alpha/beta hydrolase domain-containing protein [Acidimicrobiales bacterium]